MPDRPRDRLGRPLSHGSPDSVAQVPDRSDVDAATALSEAIDYLGRDLPFHAHEVLEQRWRCAPVDERALWKALAQAAAAVTHAMRGNDSGARSVMERANDGLRAEGRAPVAGVSAAALMSALEDIRPAQG